MKQINGIIANAAGGVEVLQNVNLPLSPLKPFEILIAVKSAGINRPDILQRKGLYPAPKDASPILGLELAGEVVAIGANVTRWKINDKVMALVNGGGYANLAIAHENLCFAKPKAFSWEQAACLPEALFTVWHNVFERGNLRGGETLLIHGGNSGIGTLAIQMGKAFGAKVIVTCRGVEKCTATLELGADFAIDTTNHNFAEQVKTLTNGAGANAILDMIGGEFVALNYEAAAVEGRIVNIAFQTGSKVSVDMQRIMLKRLHQTGSTLRSRSVEDKAKMAQAIRENALAWLNEGKVKPIIHSIFKLQDVAKAHEALEAGNVFGKVVLVV